MSCVSVVAESQPIFSEDIHSDEIGSEFVVPSESTLTEDDDIADMPSETHATTDEIDSTIRTPTLHRPMGISTAIVSNKGPQPKYAGCGLLIDRDAQRLFADADYKPNRNWKQTKSFHCNSLCLTAIKSEVYRQQALSIVPSTQ